MKIQKYIICERTHTCTNPHTHTYTYIRTMEQSVCGWQYIYLYESPSKCTKPHPESRA